MKLKFNTYLLLLFCCIVTVQCKKTGYEEGPKRSLRSTEKKLNLTAWELEYYGINGIDSLTQFKMKTCYSKIKFYTEKEGYQYIYAIPDGGHFAIYGIEKKDNNILHINGGSAASNGILCHPFISDTITNWKIIQFYPKKSLWVKTTFKNSEYFLKFKRISYEGF